MNAFVTETLPEDLDVLLFSQTPVLADLFADQLTQHGLQVTQKSSDLASLTHFLNSGLSSTWYKVFWIDDVNHLTIDQAKKMVQIFQEIKGLSYLVMHQPFTYHGQKQFELIGQKLIDISVFFEQRSPYTSVLTFRDLLSNEAFSLNYQQIIHFLNKSKFPFTDDQIGFLSDREVMEGLATLSFDPRGGKRRVVVGKRPILTKTLMKAVQNEFRRRFKGEEVLLQRDVKVEWSDGFKDFSVPSSATLDEVVSELIVEAKFHYQPEKVEEFIPDSIPKPNIPKAKPVILKPEVTKPKPEENVKSFVAEIEEETEQLPVKDSKLEEKIEKLVPKSIAAQPKIDKVEKTLPKKLVRTLNTQEFLENLPLSELVPKSIQENMIQVHVQAPVAVAINRPPILIPEQRMPEIRRSKIILHQFSTSLENHVPTRPVEQQIIPKISPQIAARVLQEQQHEKEKHQEYEKEEDQKKKMLENKIANLFSGTLKPQRTLTLRRKERVTPIQILFGRDTKIGKWYRAQKTIFWFCLAVSITTISLVGLFFFSVTSLERNLMKIAQHFEQGIEVDKADTDSLIFSQNLLKKQLSIYSTVAGTGIFSDAYTDLELSQKLSTLTIALGEIQSSHVKTIRQVLGAESGDPVATLIPSLGQTDTVYKQLSLLEAELEDADSNSFFHTHFAEEQQKDLIDSISEIRRNVLVGQQLTEVLPNVLNKEQKKTIAVVLQDSQELRATGGFVQAVALVTLDGGKVSDVKIVKPDSLSDTVGGEVNPPEEVTEYLGEKQLFLRDGNWNPNFEATSKQIKFFLEKGLSTQIDGVVGINTNSLAKIIGAIGSVTVKDFDDETITEKNFAERQFFYAKASLLNNADAASKPEFLNSVFKVTLDKLKTIDDTQTKQLMTVLSDQLKQAEVTMSFQDLATETTMGTLGWTGNIIAPPCPTQLVQDQCLVSRIYQIDSNVGVNKVNYSVKKKVGHSIQIKPENIIHQRTVTYENSSNTNSWPGGVYKNYIRWYLPDNVKLRTVTINDKEVEAEKIKQYQDKSSKVVGVYVEVLPETTAKVVLEYEEESIGKQASYAFFDQKQPGTGSTPAKISIFYDPQYVPTVIAPEAQISGEKIEYSFWGGEHSFAGVKFR